MRNASQRSRTLTKILLLGALCTLAPLKAARGKGEQGDQLKAALASNMPHYPGAQDAPFGERTRVGGAPVEMTMFSVADEPQAIGDYYAAYWRSHNLYVRYDVNARGGVISAVDGKGGLVYQILMMIDGKQTLVFPSVTQIPRRPADPSAVHSPVALYPGSRGVMEVNTAERDKAAQIIMSVNDGSEEANVAHYDQAARAIGFVRDAAADVKIAKDQRLWIYRNARGDELTLSLSRSGSSPSVGELRTRVHLTLIHATGDGA